MATIRSLLLLVLCSGKWVKNGKIIHRTYWTEQNLDAYVWWSICGFLFLSNYHRIIEGMNNSFSSFHLDTKDVFFLKIILYAFWSLVNTMSPSTLEFSRNFIHFQIHHLYTEFILFFSFQDEWINQSPTWNWKKIHFAQNETRDKFIYKYFTQDF